MPGRGLMMVMRMCVLSLLSDVSHSRRRPPADSMLKEQFGQATVQNADWPAHSLVEDEYLLAPPLCASPGAGGL